MEHILQEMNLSSDPLTNLKLHYIILMYPHRKTNDRNLKIVEKDYRWKEESSEPNLNQKPSVFKVPAVGFIGLWTVSIPSSSRGHGPGWDRVMYLHDALNGSSQLACKWSLGKPEGLGKFGVYRLYMRYTYIYIYICMHIYITYILYNMLCIFIFM